MYLHSSLRYFGQNALAYLSPYRARESNRGLYGIMVCHPPRTSTHKHGVYPTWQYCPNSWIIASTEKVACTQIYEFPRSVPVFKHFRKHPRWTYPEETNSKRQPPPPPLPRTRSMLHILVSPHDPHKLDIPWVIYGDIYSSAKQPGQYHLHGRYDVTGFGKSS